jgi:hypothetical protein
MNQAYRDMMSPITDDEERARVLKPIMDYAESLDNKVVTTAHTFKSIVSTMQSAKDQFTGLVRSQFLLSPFLVLILYARQLLITIWRISRSSVQSYTQELMRQAGKHQRYSGVQTLCRN